MPLFELFDQAYGSEEITEDGIAKALAQYIRTIISGTSNFDKYVEGNYQFTPSEQLGFDISITNRRLLSLPWRSNFGLPDGSFWIVAVLQQWPRQYA